MQRMLRSVLLLVFASSTLIAPLHAAQPQGATSLQTDRPSRLEVSFSTEQPALIESLQEEGSFTTFDTDLPLSGEPGEPALPAVTKVLGIPSSAAPEANFQTATPQSLGTLSQPLEPVPYDVPVEDEASANPENVPELVQEYVPDAELYARSEWFPANPVLVSEPTMLRDQAIVRVTFYPVQVNLATGEVRWTPSADVTLSWDAATLQPPVEITEDPHWESIYRATLDNYEAARAWRTPGEISSGSDAPNSTQGTTRWLLSLKGKGLFKIPLSQLQAAGVPTAAPERIAVYLGQQEQAVWMNGGNLYLINQQEPGRWSETVAYRLEILPSGTGKRMTPVASPANQSQTLSSVRYDLTFEEDVVYERQVAPSIPGEHWHWVKLRVYKNEALPQQRSWETPFALPYLASGFDAVVTTELGPLANRCHSATVTLNGAYSASRGIYAPDDPAACLNTSNPDKWYDTSAFGKSVTIPAGAVSATNNTFKAEIRPAPITDNNTAGGDEMMLNSFTVQYQRLLVVNAPDSELFFKSGQTAGRNFQIQGLGASAVAFVVQPDGNHTLISGVTPSGNTFTFGRPAPTNEQYLVTSTERAHAIDSIRQIEDHGLRTDLSRTEYLIITTPQFVAPLQALVNHRQSVAGGGLNVRITTTEDIYSDFGVGMVDPVAIRAFIKYGYHMWRNPGGGPVLSYVLLVGDATSDPFNRTGQPNPLLPELMVPPMMEDVKNYRNNLTELPTDNGLVDAMNACTDDVPPYPSTCEPRTDPMPDIHVGRLPARSVAEVQAMVNKIISYETNPAPGDWQRRITLVTDDPDEGGDFYHLSDEIVPLLPDGMMAAKAYHITGTDPLITRNRIVNELNYGSAILNYIGHGETSAWGGRQGFWTANRVGSGGARSNDLELLTNASRLTVSLSWTCSDGYFVDPTVQGLAEDSARWPEEGAIAAFAPLDLDVATAHDFMTMGFYKALSNYDGTLPAPEREMGPLTTHSKAYLYTNSTNTAYRRLLDTYALFGDPALRVNVNTEARSVFLPLSQKR